MRIDFVAPRFHPSTGGIEESIEGLAVDLLARGHVVTVHTTHRPELAFEESWQGIRIRRYKPFPQLGYYASRFRPRLDGDVIHLHAYAHATNDWVIRHHAGRTPVFLSTHHGLAFPKRGLLGRAYHATYNAVGGIRHLGRLQGLLVPTEYDADLFRRRGVPASIVRVLPTGLAEDAFRASGPVPLPWPTARPFILFLGRLHREKGVIDLVDAYERADIQWDLVLAGPDEGAGAELARRARAPSLQGRLHVAGLLEPAQKWSALDRCEFLVLPSHHEGQGIVVVEAWARGKAVLATRAGGLAHLVRPEQDGILVNTRDALQLRGGLERLARDPDLRHRLGESGRTRAAAEFRRSRIVDVLVASYRAALNGSSSGSSGARATGRTA